MTTLRPGLSWLKYWGGAIAVTVAISSLGWSILHRPSSPPATDRGSSARAGNVSPVPVARTNVRSTPAPRGLLVNDARAYQGYTLIAPMTSTSTYLIDMEARVVKAWHSKYFAGESAYFLENGHLLRPAKLAPEEQLFGGSGQGGRVQEFSWDGELLWDFRFHNDRQLAHHDVCRLPNGNILLPVWEIKTDQEALAAGRDPKRLYPRWLADAIVEIKPTGKTTGEVVWEWHAWDHAVQEQDPARANYGKVADHPELIDINSGEDGQPYRSPFPAAQRDEAKRRAQSARQEVEKLKSLGYVGSLAAPGNQFTLPEWNHVNAVAYDAETDRIMICPRDFCEIWILDHSTTRAEAASHKGGRSGKGGDLLYRWGNPLAHKAGMPYDQALFFPHDAHWIAKEKPGAGHVLIFNNGGGRASRMFSSVDELILPAIPDATDAHTQSAAPGPSTVVWSYTAPRKEEFFASIMSGADRLPNGNTIICDSLAGKIFEVTPQQETVWSYVIPDGVAPRGQTGGVPVFRAYRYGADYPGLAGKALKPGKKLGESSRPVKVAAK